MLIVGQKRQSGGRGAAVCLGVALVLIGSGIVYRYAAGRLELISERPITLPVPLEAFPKTINGWAGSDVPVPETIQEAANNDDFVYRLYANEEAGKWAKVYAAYSARPRTMLGHKPQICYPAGGWVHDGTDESVIVSRGGRSVECLLHRFHKPAPAHNVEVVVQFYIVNGQITADDGDFSGVSWRTPNLEGSAARYVAQIQVSSVVEHFARIAVADLVDELLGFFPDTRDQHGLRAHPTKNIKD